MNLLSCFRDISLPPTSRQDKDSTTLTPTPTSEAQGIKQTQKPLLLSLFLPCFSAQRKTFSPTIANPVQVFGSLDWITQHQKFKTNNNNNNKKIMGILHDDVVLIRPPEKEGDPTVITVNCPDKTGLGCDLCRIILFFGLSIVKGGNSTSQLASHVSWFTHTHQVCTY